MTILSLLSCRILQFRYGTTSIWYQYKVTRCVRFDPHLGPLAHGLLARFNNYCEEISELIEDQEELQIDVNESKDFEVDMENQLIIIDNFIRKNEKVEKSSSVSSKGGDKSQSVKLPQLDIKKFDGDATEWQSFIDSFEAMINAN